MYFVRKECSDARKSFKKLASRTGRRHLVREGRSDARKSEQNLASRTEKGYFVRKECSNARKSAQNLASRTGKGHLVREGRSDARESGQKLASRTGKGYFVRDGAIARWEGAIEMGQYGLGNVRGVKNILLFLQGRLERCGYERFCKPHQPITNQ